MLRGVWIGLARAVFSVGGCSKVVTEPLANAVVFEP